MATNIAHETSDSGDVVAIVAIVILIGLAIAFFIYGLPWLQNRDTATQQQPGTSIDINGSLPTPQTQPQPQTTPNP